MRKFTFPRATELYGGADSLGERYDKVQYYNACMKWENRLADFGVLKRPPEMTWLMDEAGREKELSRWKSNGWYTEPDMSGYVKADVPSGEPAVRSVRRGDGTEDPAGDLRLK